MFTVTLFETFFWPAASRLRGLAGNRLIHPKPEASCFSGFRVCFANSNVIELGGGGGGRLYFNMGGLGLEIFVVQCSGCKQQLKSYVLNLKVFHRAHNARILFLVIDWSVAGLPLDPRPQQSLSEP